MTRWPTALWRMPAAAPPRIPVARDVVVSAIVIALVALETGVRLGEPGIVVHAIAISGAAVLLPWRRRMPLSAFAASAMLGFTAAVITGHDMDLVSGAFLLLYPYSLVRWGSGRAIVVGITGIVVVQTGFVIAGGTSVADGIGGAVVIVALAAIATAVRSRAAARARELEFAAVRERERLARDLHDTVAHHVSAIAVSANAGLVAGESSPERATEALRVIGLEASRTLDEMRSIVRLLRDDEPTGDPLDRVRALAVAAATGPTVDIAITGDVDGLGSAVGDAVARIVQESVTNARRHARAASRVEVRIDAASDSVRVRICDDGRSSGPAAEGYGLRGMRERAALVGGTLDAGPAGERPDDSGGAQEGGWVVEAVIPLPGRRGDR